MSGSINLQASDGDTSDSVIAHTELSRILIIDDDPQVGTLQRLYIEEMGYQAEVAIDTKSALASIERAQPSLLIIDYKLAESCNGLEFYRTLLGRDLNIPAILVTALGHEDVLVEAMHLGVRGFVLKTPTYWRDFKETIARVMRFSALEREAVEAKAAKDSEARVQAALEAASVGYWRWESQTGKFWASPMFRLLLGVNEHTRIESVSDLQQIVHPVDRDRLQMFFEAAGKTHQVLRDEYRIQAASQQRWLLFKGAALKGHPGVVSGALSDITPNKEAQEQLRQSYQEIQSLNQQLQANMVETHHRVKNSLQIVNSLVNMEMRRADSFTPKDLQKVAAHIQAFATLHDILTEQSKELSRTNCGTSVVGAHEMLTRLLELLAALSEGRLTVDRLDVVWVSVRQSAA
ncbi:MAG: response regulator, partial [Proteobacteria bacterium]|nr:response regulator [Pseudomonadota bacterium]